MTLTREPKITRTPQTSFIWETDSLILNQLITSLIPVSELSDKTLISLCNSEMLVEQQEEMNELLVKQRENQLGKSERVRLNELLIVYRRGLIRKAEALKIAVERGLIPPLS